MFCAKVFGFEDVVAFGLVAEVDERFGEYFDVDSGVIKCAECDMVVFDGLAGVGDGIVDGFGVWILGDIGIPKLFDELVECQHDFAPANCSFNTYECSFVLYRVNLCEIVYNPFMKLLDCVVLSAEDYG